MNELRLAFRAIARLPVYAAVVIGSLAAGIGVNTVVFSWIQARILEPMPGVRGGSRFYGIEPINDNGLYSGSSWLEYNDLRARLTAFSDVLAFRMVPLYLGDAGRVDRAYGLLVSDNYFSALGLKPEVGRFLQAGDTARPGGEPIAVISYGLWQSHFGGVRDVVGQPLRVNGRELQVVGVTPRIFQGTVMGLNFDVWLPATLAPVVLTGSRELEDRNNRGYGLLGRLSPSSTRDAAQREVTAAMRELSQAHPSTNGTLSAEVLAFWESPRGPQRLLTTALGILQAVMLLLLLAVCGNTANLALARASARQKEIGMRLALGASRARIARLLMTETVVLGVIGAAVGAAFAVWGTNALMVLPLTGLPIKFQTSVNGISVAFAATLGVLSGALTGAVPALQLARLHPQQALRAGSRAAGRSRVRNTLMAVQVALASIILIVAGLFLRSFLETRTADTGFRREGVLLAAYDLTGRNLPSAAVRTFAGRVLDGVRQLPGVEAAAISSSVPLDIHGLPSRVFALEGYARPDGQFDQALSNTVTPGYFQAMEIPLLAGTDFCDLADAAHPPEAIVNEAFARTYVGGASPIAASIGRRLELRGRTFSIAGVVRNSLYNAFGEPPTPAIYVSYRDNPVQQGEIHVRTRPGTETAIAPEIRRAVREIDPVLPIFNVRTLGDHIETNLVFRRVPARMFAVLGPLLLVLVAIGIYAVVSYAVSLRTTEIGLRRALGATTPRLIAQFVGQSLGVAAVGGLAGWLVVFFGYSLVTDRPVDLAVFIGVPVVLLAVSALACWLPARRAARIDPMIALRRD